MGKKIVYTGQVVIDLAMSVPHLPMPGGDIRATSHLLTPGGGFNVLSAAAAMGADVSYAGAMGTGAWADLAWEGLHRIGVPHIGPVLDESQGCVVALTDEDAERTFITVPGAESKFPPGCTDSLDVADSILVLSGYSLTYPEKVSELNRLLDRIEPGSCQVIVDVAPVVADIPLESLNLAREHRPIWSMNEFEEHVLAARFEITGRGEERAAALAEVLGGPVIARKGAIGALVADGTGDVTLLASIDVDCVDTNGAGDAHTGVMCAFLAEGANLHHSVRAGNVAGALATTTFGPATCPPRQTVEAHL